MFGNLYGFIALVITLAVAIAYINYRTIKMPLTTAIMTGSLLLSLLFIMIGKFGFNHERELVAKALAQLNFHDLLMNGMLSFLLFAGALTIDINALKDQKWEVGILAFISTIVSTFLIGTAMYFILRWIGQPLGLIYCLLFGALISPTDPIAVLALFKELKVSRSLDVRIACEALFNDGVGIVIFLTLYTVAFSPKIFHASDILLLFSRETLGGIAYGIALGLFAYWLIKPIDDHRLEIMLTIAVATGGYALAQVLDTSGPLAMVTAGIFLGNRGRQFRMSKQTRERLDNFWELIDELLNVILFFLIGLELLVIRISAREIWAGVIAIIITLLARFITVGIPTSIFKRYRSYVPHVIKIMTWGGLRGGLAIALALALPNGSERHIILTMTYAVAAFSIIVQGMTMKSLILLSQRKMQVQERN